MDLNDVGKVWPCPVGDRVTGCEHDGHPLLQHLIGTPHHHPELSLQEG